MRKAKQISVFISVFLLAILIGGIAYSHMAFFPSYLHNLPDSASLVQGAYPIQDEKFWMLIHPITILSLLISIVLNWKVPVLRKYMLGTLVVYIVALGVTAVYFVPELKAFAQSNVTTIESVDWAQRGIKWEKLSWIRGAFMFSGFFLLLLALVNVQGNLSNAQPAK